MGNAGSAHAQASLQVVARLSGDAPLPLAAPEWQQLLAYSTPLSRFDPDEVEREIRPHCAELGAWGRLWQSGCWCDAAPPSPSPGRPLAFFWLSHCASVPMASPCSVQQCDHAQPAAADLLGVAAAAAGAQAGALSARLMPAATPRVFTWFVVPAAMGRCFPDTLFCLAHVRSCHPMLARLHPLPQGTMPSAAAANAVYCLRTILKDLMEQLNGTQLLSFIELPHDALVAGTAGNASGTAVDAGSPPSSPSAAQRQPQKQQQAAEAAGGAEVVSLGSGASSPTTADGSGQHEFEHLHNASLVQVRGAGRASGTCRALRDTQLRCCSIMGWLKPSGPPPPSPVWLLRIACRRWSVRRCRHWPATSCCEAHLCLAAHA